MLGSKSGDTPCPVQRRSKSETADRVALGGGGTPALESDATEACCGAVDRSGTGAVTPGRGECARLRTSDVLRTTAGFATGLT